MASSCGLASLWCGRFRGYYLLIFYMAAQGCKHQCSSAEVEAVSHSVISMHSICESNTSLPRSKARGISLPRDKEIARSHSRRAYWVGETL